MSKKLFFGNLPYSTTDADLQKMAGEHGTVEEATIIMDRMTNRSKGFGFVTMSTDEEAQKVIAAFNGQEVGGRKWIVNEARPQEDRPRREFNDRGPRM